MSEKSTNKKDAVNEDVLALDELFVADAEVTEVGDAVDPIVELNTEIEEDISHSLRLTLTDQDSPIRSEIEASLLASIINEKSTRVLDTLVTLGLNHEMFTNDNQTVFLELVEHRNRYKEIPNWHQVRRAAPNNYSNLKTAKIGNAVSLFDNLVDENVTMAVVEQIRTVYDMTRKNTKGRELLEKLVTSVLDVSNRFGQLTSSPTNLSDLIPQVIEKYEMKERGEFAGWPIPFPFIMNATLGFEPNSFTTVLAKPGVGKTWAALLCADAVVHGDPYRWTDPISGDKWSDELKKKMRTRVLIVSLEMPSSEIATRLCCLFSGSPPLAVSKGQLNPGQKERFMEYLNTMRYGDGEFSWLGSAVKIIGPREASSLMQIQQHAADFGAEFVIIDAFYFLKAPGVDGNIRWQHIQENMRTLRTLTITNSPHYLVTSQYKVTSSAEEELDASAFSQSIAQDSPNIIHIARGVQMARNHQAKITPMKLRNSGADAPHIYTWHTGNLIFREVGPADLDQGGVPSTGRIRYETF